MTSEAPTDKVQVTAPAIMQRLRPHLPPLVLVTSLAVIFALRYMAVMQHLDMGPDIANYLTTMNTLFGEDVTGLGLLRPPLIAFPLKAFTFAFGNLTGAKILGVLISVAIGIPFYWLAKRISHSWIAVATTVLFVLTTAYAEMLAWGYITMTGILFILLFLHFFISLPERHSIVNIVLAGIAFSLVAGFHQLSFAFFLLLLLALVAGLALLSRESLLRSYRPLLLSLAIGGLLCLPYAPVYIRLLGMQEGADTASSISFAPLADLGFHLLQLPLALGMVVAIALTTAGLIWLWHQDRDRAVLVGTVFLFSLALSLFLLPPPFAELNRRADFFLYIPIWLIAGVVLSQIWTWQSHRLTTLLRWLPRAITVAAIIALLCTSTIMSQRGLRDGLDFYGYLDDTRWNAVQWIGANTPEDAIIATYPENLAWWMEAEAQRTVFGVTARHMAPYAVMRDRSLVAERLLSRNQGIENGILRLANSYPYTGTPGNPVIGTYVSGTYHDMLMFCDTQNLLETEGTPTPNMDDVPKEFVINGNTDSMEMITSYQTHETRVTQTARLDRGGQSADISYRIQSDTSLQTRLDVPLLFCFLPESVSVDPNGHSVEIVQKMKTPFDGIVSVITCITVEAAGAVLVMSAPETDRVPLSLHLQGSNAILSLTLTVTNPTYKSRADVLRYEVPQLIRDHSVRYIAVDLKPASQIWAHLPDATAEWLDRCPYYTLVHSDADVRVYHIDVSSLP